MRCVSACLVLVAPRNVGFPRSFNGGNPIGDEAFIPKGQAERIIPITIPARPVLERRCEGLSDTERLFPYDSPGRLTKALRAAVAEAVAQKPGLDVQALRHSAGYFWAERGMSPWDVKDLLRHKSLRTTEPYYVQKVFRGQKQRFDQTFRTSPDHVLPAAPETWPAIAFEKQKR